MINSCSSAITRSWDSMYSHLPLTAPISAWWLWSKGAGPDRTLGQAAAQCRLQHLCCTRVRQAAARHLEDSHIAHLCHSQQPALCVRTHTLRVMRVSLIRLVTAAQPQCPTSVLPFKWSINGEATVAKLDWVCQMRPPPIRRATSVQVRE